MQEQRLTDTGPEVTLVTDLEQYRLLLRGGIVQSVPRNCNHFLIYCASHLSSDHSRFIHQRTLLWLQQRNLGPKLG
jgi:hypothetical protein